MGRAYLTLLPVILLWASTPLLVSELSRELPAAQINVLTAYLAAGCGAFFWALFSVLSKRYCFEPLSSMLMFNVAALPCFASVALILSGPLLQGLRPGRGWPRISQLLRRSKAPSSSLNRRGTWRRSSGEPT